MRRRSLLLVLLLVAVLVPGSLALLQYRDDISQARSSVESGGRFARTSAGVIEYAETGSGMVLLSIHGAGGGYDQGLANAAELVGEGYRVIAPSRFGYLGTPIPADASPAAQADAHAALLDALKIDRAIVVGISAGARSAVQMALRHSDMVAALVLIVPGTYAEERPVAVDASRGSQFAFWLVNAGADFAWWATEKTAPSVLIRFIGVPPEIVAKSLQVEQERVMHIVRSVQPLSRRFPGINLDSNPDGQRPPLEQISAPTLVISARDDLFNTLPAAEFAASRIPGARLVVFNEGGHLLVAHEQEVRTIVSEFLDKAGVNLPQVQHGSAKGLP